MPITTTITRSSNHGHHHHDQRHAATGAGAQLVVLVVLVLNLRMLVVEGSQVPAMPASCFLVCGGILLYACFTQDDPWYLVSRPFYAIKLCKLGTALKTTRAEGDRETETPSVSKSVDLSLRT